MIRLLIPKIRCLWCGQEIPVLTTRPKKCPYCGGLLWNFISKVLSLKILSHIFLLVVEVQLSVYSFDETLSREPLNVRLSRMCEEYDAFMRYKFRDSEEFKLCNAT